MLVAADVFVRFCPYQAEAVSALQSDHEHTSLYNLAVLIFFWVGKGSWDDRRVAEPLVGIRCDPRMIMTV